MFMKIKKIFGTAALILAAMVLLAGCATSSPGSPALSGLLSLEEALEAAATAIEDRVAGGSAIAVYKITASHDEIGEHLAEDLNDRISMRGSLNLLAREAALRFVDTEHSFQMSGLVSDATVVSLGSYIGAEVVVSGTFNRFADFSQLRLRVVEVRTSSLLVSYTARISNADRILANITAPFDTTPAPRIAENALTHLNRGKDLFVESRFDEAIAEFERAIAIDSSLAEVYLFRGTSYIHKNEYDRAIADLDRAIQLNPNDAMAYSNRGFSQHQMGNHDQAIADFTEAIQINQNFAVAYSNRGFSQHQMGNHDQAVADFTEAIRLNPNFVEAFINRGYVYNILGDQVRAIADYTEAVRLNPNLAPVFVNRGLIYRAMEDFDRAIEDFTQAILLNQNDAGAFFNRGFSYQLRGDIDRAIADYEAALRINPDHFWARASREGIRQEHGR